MKKSGVDIVDAMFSEDSKFFQGLIKHVNAEDTYLNSTEYVRLNQPTEKGPKLPFGISGHSMVKVNDTTVYITGGGGVGEATDETWIADFSDGFKINKG